MEMHAGVDAQHIPVDEVTVVLYDICGETSKAMGYISPIPKGDCLRSPFFFPCF